MSCAVNTDMLGLAQTPKKESRASLTCLYKKPRSFVYKSRLLTMYRNACIPTQTEKGHGQLLKENALHSLIHSLIGACCVDD